MWFVPDPVNQTQNRQVCHISKQLWHAPMLRIVLVTWHGCICTSGSRHRVETSVSRQPYLALSSLAKPGCQPVYPFGVVFVCLFYFIINKKPILLHYCVLSPSLHPTTLTGATIIYSMWKIMCFWTLNHINALHYTKYTNFVLFSNVIWPL